MCWIAAQSTVLQALHATLTNSVLLDKDVVNQALLEPDHAMFDEYYDKCVKKPRNCNSHVFLAKP